ncbi:ferredoxin [Candidatus Pacearchaeota archaeon CG06_land_8_20_14_3_00_35_12]|nr:MAG: ferredoxin [Candidatus Pacearchaeota archaeon CG06_land_8_20_14_3_00_35_12]
MAKYKVSVDAKKCIGCGACVSACPKNFKLKDGKSHPIKAEIDEKDLKCVQEAVKICPVCAIAIKKAK